MATTRVTNQMKDTFVSQLTAKIYNERVKAATEAVQSLGDEYYRVFISEDEEKALNELPEHFVPSQDDVGTCVRVIGGGAFGQRTEAGQRITKLKFDEKRKTLNNVFKPHYFCSHEILIKDRLVEASPVGFNEHCPDERKLKTMLQKKLSAFTRKHCKIFQEYGKVSREKEIFEEELKRALASVRTVKAVKALSKEISAAWDEIMGAEGSEKNLPALVPDAVNKAIRQAALTGKKAA